MAERASDEDLKWMRRAIELARVARDLDESPVAALIVRNGEEFASGCNEIVSSRDPTAHAVTLAVRRAAATLDGSEFDGTTLYVTREPCVMCTGTILAAGVTRIVFGAARAETGALRSRYALADDPRSTVRALVTGGVLESECAALECEESVVERNEVTRGEETVTGIAFRAIAAAGEEEELNERQERKDQNERQELSGEERAEGSLAWDDGWELTPDRELPESAPETQVSMGALQLDGDSALPSEVDSWAELSSRMSSAVTEEIHNAITAPNHLALSDDPPTRVGLSVSSIEADSSIGAALSVSSIEADPPTRVGLPVLDAFITSSASAPAVDLAETIARYEQKHPKPKRPEPKNQAVQQTFASGSTPELIAAAPHPETFHVASDKELGRIQTLAEMAAKVPNGIIGPVADPNWRVVEPIAQNGTSRGLAIIATIGDKDVGAAFAMHPLAGAFYRTLTDFSLVLHPDHRGTGLDQRLVAEFGRLLLIRLPYIRRIELLVPFASHRIRRVYTGLGFDEEVQLPRRILSRAGFSPDDSPNGQPQLTATDVHAQIRLVKTLDPSA